MTRYKVLQPPVPPRSQPQQHSKPIIHTQNLFYLGKYQYFRNNLKQLYREDPIVENLHALLFPGQPIVKKNLLKFHGFPPGRTVADIANTVLSIPSWTSKCLRETLGIFGLSEGGNRVVLSKRLASYLLNPKCIVPNEDSFEKDSESEHDNSLVNEVMILISS
jgi:hypothetical protein